MPYNLFLIATMKELEEDKVKDEDDGEQRRIV